MLEAFALFTFGFLVGSAVKGWICEARELRQARDTYLRTLPEVGMHRLSRPGKGTR